MSKNRKQNNVVPIQQNTTGSIPVEMLLTEQASLDKQIQQVNQALAKLESDRTQLIVRQHALAGARSYNASLIQMAQKQKVAEPVIAAPDLPEEVITQ